MHRRLRTAGTVLLVALSTVWLGCASSAVARRGLDQEERPVQNVAIVLFMNDVPGTPPHFAELATDAFTLEMKRYFPGLVDRYRMREFLAANGFDGRGAITPRALEAAGAEFGVDGVFVGTITGFGDKRSFLGWKERPYFLMGCRFYSTENGRVLIAGQTSVTESVPLPVEDPKQMAVYGVKSLIDRMRLDERFGPPALTRDDPLWRRAMRAYEERRFWDAGEDFAAIVSIYRPNDLREEARLCLGRCLEEIGFVEAARELYLGMRDGPFAAPALCRAAEIAAGAGEPEPALALLEEIARRFPGSPEEGAARYAAGTALAGAGRPREAAVLLEEVPEGSSWRRFARYALAGALVQLGEEPRARAALEAAAAVGGSTTSDRRLRERALLALGDLHYAEGRPAEAERCWAEVAGEGAEEAALARAWLAAEEERFADAALFARPIERSDDLRRAAEASLVAGSCLSRLGAWAEAERALRGALASCDAWEEESARRAERRSELGEARLARGAEIESHASVIVDLLAGTAADSDDELRSLKGRCRALDLRIARAEREIGPAEPDDAAEGLSAIRERADFSLAQVLYESGRGETREAAWAGGEGGSR
ncbi:MAG: hypothetical protein EHM19_05550 [Candidatus Latescibacterota bacterium]|nr:MAG: hypothetical protein EHM19_05550 [Candidatus Latescibacterota bacterium]